ncbi:growth-regulating factor 1 [Brachypodium distachyon]|uniref:Growth-regulating factor n=1 Tax=Brachypodium distachyon TaxID=15368 RepID=I1IEL9_BRADI|nr:growth-regulating factor 1 [Brachypodium distachyon]KQK01641.1 hypothetical protein BRADI_3g57267v3 [Brachypodium distachyon]|eukprot:XP_003570521.1 growth-regulating factor 1 [Brachypodium distachyon]
MMMLGGRAAGAGGGGGGRCPFTATQWQELEHQALIYKYMASGVPIPSDLLLPLRRSFLFDPALATSPSLAFSPQSSLGWGCFGMGFGRKAEDPEPGRCRRTDGKKWRCSKEAYPDSKYCEKHMHRGKNRSRKPVEMSLATPPPSSSSSLSASSSSTNASSAINAATTTTTSSSPAPSYHHHHRHESSSPYTHHALYGAGAGGPYGGRQQGYQVSGSPYHLHLDTTHPHPPPSYYSSAMDHHKEHYAYGHTVLKEPPPTHGEHAFFSSSDHHAADRPGSDHGQWQFKQLGMEPPHKHNNNNNTPILFYGNNGNNNGNGAAYAIDLCKEDDEEKERRQQQQHCFLLGADLRLDKPSSQHAAQAKPLRPFFDEWPHENKGGGGKPGSWMGLDGETQLSISIPMASANDLPITTTSRYHHGE